MKAAVMYEIRQPLHVEELELSEPRQREVLVKLVASGVCHSDITMLDGLFPGYGETPPLPMVLGHEGAGIVEAVGPGVKTVAPGDHAILVGGGPSCGECRFCLTDRPARCISRQPSIGPRADGTTRLHKGGQDIFHFGTTTFAEYTVVPEIACVKIREDAPLDKMCLLGCGVKTGLNEVY